MKIQYMSDLHLEFVENRLYFENNPILPVGDILVLAGDIITDPLFAEAEPFFEDIEKKFRLIISTMGNHEFYGSNISYAYPSYQQKITSKHYKLNNETLIFENTRFLVTTLWSRIAPEHQEEIGCRLNDYHLIKINAPEGERLITVDDINDIFDHSLNYLKSELSQEFVGKTVIITHHIPYIECVIPKWRDSSLRSAFVAYTSDIIEQYQPDAWIFGHQHDPYQGNIGITKVVANPLGYYHEGGFASFNGQLFLEI